MRASLADQAGAGGDAPRASLAIALGANLPSPAGPPLATLLAVRPLLEQLVDHQLLEPGAEGRAAVRWSPLFRTAPVGGPPGQPDYLNAAVLVSQTRRATPASALQLLADLQKLELRFARRRRERWGPRSLDLDLLWWGDLHCRDASLELPHPRLQERSFVLAPLAAIDAGLVPPGADPGSETCVAALLARLEPGGADDAPERLAGRTGWPE